VFASVHRAWCRQPTSRAWPGLQPASEPLAGDAMVSCGGDDDDDAGSEGVVWVHLVVGGAGVGIG